MKTFFIFSLLVYVQCLSAQEVKLLPSADKLLLGEKMNVKIQTTVMAGEPCSYFYVDTLSHFEILERSKIDTQAVNGSLQLTQILVVTSWDSGKWNFPTLITAGIPSAPFPISITYTSPWDPKKPYNDIKGIVPVKHADKNHWWWYVIGAAVLVALFLLFFPQGKKEETISTLDAGAYKKAMQAMNKLQKESTSSANAKEFYTELITIFRTYLKGAKGIQSFSKTTDDLGIQLQSLKIPSAAYNELLQTLRLSDLVKFAQYTPGSEITNSAFTTIKQSITTIEQGHAV